MKAEIKNEIDKFKTRWKHHTLNVILGGVFLLCWVAVTLLTIYTLILYNGDNKIYCIMIEIVMWLVSKKLYRDIMPDKETRLLYISEYYQLDIKIQNMIETEMHNELNSLIRHISNNKEEEK